MLWAVYAPITRPAGALAGSYVGASAKASVVAGIGANVLVGGSNRTIELQPLAVQGQTGLNIAAGVAGIELRWGVKDLQGLLSVTVPASAMSVTGDNSTDLMMSGTLAAVNTALGVIRMLLGTQAWPRFRK